MELFELLSDLVQFYSGSEYFDANFEEQRYVENIFGMDSASLRYKSRIFAWITFKELWVAKF